MVPWWKYQKLMQIVWVKYLKMYFQWFTGKWKYIVGAEVASHAPVYVLCSLDGGIESTVVIRE